MDFKKHHSRGKSTDAKTSLPTDAAQAIDVATPALRVEKVEWALKELEIVTSTSFTVPRASMSALVGPNGAGKSTLFRLLAGVLAPQRGEVFFFDRALQDYSASQRRKTIGYMPQDFAVDWQFPITVGEVVEMGVYAYASFFRTLRRSEKQWAAQCLESVQLSHLKDRPIEGLSGGERRRMFFARMLAQRANFLMLDEPFAGIDEYSQGILLQLLHRLVKEGKTVLVIDHDLATVRKHFDWCILFRKTPIAFGATSKIFVAKNLSQLYHFDGFSELETTSAFLKV